MLTCLCPNDEECEALGTDFVCLPWCRYLADNESSDIKMATTKEIMADIKTDTMSWTFQYLPKLSPCPKCGKVNPSLRHAPNWQVKRGLLLGHLVGLFKVHAVVYGILRDC